VGFAPANDPKFVMLVKLKEPQSSPWASETAAPLWFDLAHQVLLYMNIPPEN
jgi:cell division protein FtsI/penicillin-binding protein 2